jgi:hypothetical protein
MPNRKLSSLALATGPVQLADQFLVTRAGESRRVTGAEFRLDNLLSAAGANTTTRDLKTRFDEVYNVMDFGAAGTGLSTPLSAGEAAAFNTAYSAYGAQGAYAIVAGDERDYAAIQCALWKAANTGKPVYIPAGSYRINKPLVLTWTATPITGQPTYPKISRIFGDGHTTLMEFYGIAAGRGCLELLGTDNGNAVNMGIDNFTIRQDATCSVASWCMRLGDAKEVFSAKRVRFEGANGVRLKTGSITSYANLCTSFEICTFTPNYGLRWGPNSTTSVSAVDHETVAPPNDTWCDAVKFTSCLFGGRVRNRAYSSHFDQCLFYCAADRPAPYNVALHHTYGALAMTSCYFEDYHTAVFVDPEWYCQTITLNNVLIGGSPIYGATYGIRARGNGSLLNGGISHLTLIGCPLATVAHSAHTLQFDGTHGTVIDCFNKDGAGNPITINAINGALVLQIDKGNITYHGGVTTRAGIERLPSVAGSIYDNFGNFSNAINATYSINFLSDGAVGTITAYSSTFAGDATIRNGVYLGNGAANADLMLGQGGGFNVRIKNGRVRVGSVAPADDGVGALQLEGLMTLRPNTPGGTVDGSLWHDSLTAALRVQMNGFTQAMSASPVDQNSIFTLTVTNTTTETLVAGSYYPANFFKARKTVRVRIRGSMNSNGSGTLRLRVKIAGVTRLDKTIPAVDVSTNAGWLVDVDVCCRTAGVTGTLAIAGMCFYDDKTLALGASVPTVDTTVLVGVELTAEWSVASGNLSFSATNHHPEVLH